MDNLPLVLVLAGVLGIVLLAVGLARRQVRRVAETRARRERMGLRQQAAGDPQTLERIRALFRNPRGGQNRILEVWDKEVPEGRLYLVELADQSGEGNYSTVVAAVHSPDLAVPRLSLFPLLEQSGLLADMANRAIALAFKGAGNRVEFSSPGGFVRRYLVGGPDEAALRQFLTEDRRADLGETRSWHLEAEGDLVVLGLTPLDARGQRVISGDEDTLIREVMAAARLLRA